ncbi:MAG: hypothetical protein ACXQTR_03840 [Candidatus Methanospirareceae archaeon]
MAPVEVDTVQLKGHTLQLEHPEFMGEYGESLNLAVNAVADVLHTLQTQFQAETISTERFLCRNVRC